MKCLCCETMMPEGSRYCPSCGKPVIQKKCLLCGTEIRPGDHFCAGCGKPVAIALGEGKVCQRCGARLVVNANFCALCGTEVRPVKSQNHDKSEILSDSFSYHLDESTQTTEIKDYSGTSADTVIVTDSASSFHYSSVEDKESELSSPVDYQSSSYEKPNGNSSSNSFYATTATSTTGVTGSSGYASIMPDKKSEGNFEPAPNEREIAESKEEAIKVDNTLVENSKASKSQETSLASTEKKKTGSKIFLNILLVLLILLLVVGIILVIDFFTGWKILSFFGITFNL